MTLGGVLWREKHRARQDPPAKQGATWPRSRTTPSRRSSWSTAPWWSAGFDAEIRALQDRGSHVGFANPLRALPSDRRPATSRTSCGADRSPRARRASPECRDLGRRHRQRAGQGARLLQRVDARRGREHPATPGEFRRQPRRPLDPTRTVHRPGREPRRAILFLDPAAFHAASPPTSTAPHPTSWPATAVERCPPSARRQGHRPGSEGSRAGTCSAARTRRSRGAPAVHGRARERSHRGGVRLPRLDSVLARPRQPFSRPPTRRRPL